MAVATAIGFFGIDEVGIQLEAPFGLDDNDFPLMAMGLGLCHDLDAMVRTVNRTRMRRRIYGFQPHETGEVHQVANSALAWGRRLVDPPAAAPAD